MRMSSVALRQHTEKETRAKINTLPLQGVGVDNR